MEVVKQDEVVNHYFIQFKVRKIRHENPFFTVVDAEILKTELIDGNERFPIIADIRLRGKFQKLEEGDICQTEGRIQLENDQYQLGYLFVASKECIATLPVKKDEVVKYMYRKADKKITMKRILGIMDITGCGTNLLKKCYRQTDFLEQWKDEIVIRERQIINKIAKEDYALDEIMLYFNSIGLASKKAVAFYERWGIGALSKVQKNPYLLVLYECLDFSEADKVARTLKAFTNDGGNIIWNTKERIAASMFSSCLDYLSEGHSYRPLEEEMTSEGKIRNSLIDDVFYKAHRDVLDEDSKSGEEQFDSFGKVFQGALKYLTHTTKLATVLEINARQVLKIKRVLHLEKSIATNLNTIKRNDKIVKISEAEIREYFSKGKGFSGEQESAIVNALTSKISILTGGPGTGKTHTLKGITSIIKENYPDCLISCLAPTGKAAVRMSESTGITASTIHSALNSVVYRDEDTGKCYKKKMNKTEFVKIAGEFFIIDEMSMVDTELFASFLENCNENAQYLFVGDENQLQSVSHGAVLREITSSNYFPVVRLNKVFRQAETSSLITNAHKFISNSKKDIYSIEFNKTKDFLFMKNSDSKTQENLLKLIKGVIEKQKLTMEQILILSPRRTGANGSIALNTYLQDKINALTPEEAEGKEVVVFGRKKFRVNDPVIHVKNNKELGEQGISNGLIGKVVAIENGGKFMNSIDVLYPAPTGMIHYASEEDFKEVELAYVITIHKAQGSQAKAVILLLLESQRRMLYRSLVYTGMTRAESLFIGLGSEKLFYQAGLRTEDGKRLSNLGEVITAGNS